MKLRQILLFPLLLHIFSVWIWAQTGEALSFEQAAVTAATPEATQIGVDILEQGGNAIDAAVAVHFALAVTYPQAGNLGGGGFLLYRNRSGESYALDFREVAPRKAKENMYLNRRGEVIEGASTQGHLAVGVPGSVDGMIKALQRFGNLPLDLILEPSILLAREGFPLSYDQANSLNAYQEQFFQYAGSQKYFSKENREAWVAGDLFRQPDLAASLERMARFGRDGFYAGETADLIVSEMRKHNGLIDLLDLRNYESKWRTPIKTNYRGVSIELFPPPSSGGIAIAQMLKILEQYPLSNYGYGAWQYAHLFAEVARRVYADRTHYLGDPDFVDVPIPVLLSPFYLQKRMGNYSDAVATPSDAVMHGTIPGFDESLETTHFSIVDQEGNAVSVTTTLNGNFGSKVAVDGAGFLLNNEMDDFSTKPGHPNMFGLIGGKANAIAPNKRMLSSMTPLIATKNGQLFMVSGAAGGSTIITTVMQILINMVDFGMNVQQAISAPRYHHQWRPDTLFVDPFAMNRETIESLQRIGHTVIIQQGYSNRAATIMLDDRQVRHVGIDPRGNHAAKGF